MSIAPLASIAAWPTRTGSRAAPALVSRPLSGVADVEIVGGGVTGISCALTLAQAGKRVRLHEARAVASGASGRNGGFALRGGAMAYDSACEWLGREQAADYWRLTEAYVGRMGKLGGGAFRRTGSLRLAGDDEREDLRAEYETLREDGFAAEWRDELPEPLAGRFPGALSTPTTPCCSPRGSFGGWQVWRQKRASRSASTIASRIWTRSKPRRSSSPPTGTRAACSASSKG